jgi:hypothetical protein
MSRIPDHLRQQVIHRAQARCEYCQTRQLVVVSMVIDHIVPVAANGPTTLENLGLACIACNAFKLDHQDGIDPVSGERTSLFNPRTDTWNDHFHWSQDSLRLIGVTAVGRATIDRLRINRHDVIEARRLWVQAGWHPPTA